MILGGVSVSFDSHPFTWNLASELKCLQRPDKDCGALGWIMVLDLPFYHVFKPRSVVL